MSNTWPSSDSLHLTLANLVNVTSPKLFLLLSVQAFEMI